MSSINNGQSMSAVRAILNGALEAIDTLETIPDALALKADKSELVSMMKYRGSIDCSSNPNYPSSALVGYAYKVSVAGKIGGASGKVVSLGDYVVAIADNNGGTEASVGTSWDVIEGNIPGLTPNALTLLQSTFAQMRAALDLEAGTDFNTWHIERDKAFLGQTDIASATNTDIASSPTRYVRITGTTAINQFTAGTNGMIRILRFNGSLTLSNNAIYGLAGTPVVTEPGDVALFYYSAQNSLWICLSYQRASGRATVDNYEARRVGIRAIQSASSTIALDNVVSDYVILNGEAYVSIITPGANRSIGSIVTFRTNNPIHWLGSYGSIVPPSGAGTDYHGSTGDVSQWRYEGDNLWTCVGYMRFDGRAAVVDRAPNRIEVPYDRKSVEATDMQVGDVVAEVGEYAIETIYPVEYADDTINGKFIQITAPSDLGGYIQIYFIGQGRPTHQYLDVSAVLDPSGNSGAGIRFYIGHAADLSATLEIMFTNDPEQATGNTILIEDGMTVDDIGNIIVSFITPWFSSTATVNYDSGAQRINFTYFYNVNVPAIEYFGSPTQFSGGVTQVGWAPAGPPSGGTTLGLTALTANLTRQEVVSLVTGQISSDPTFEVASVDGGYGLQITWKVKGVNVIEQGYGGIEDWTLVHTRDGADPRHTCLVIDPSKAGTKDAFARLAPDEDDPA